MLRHLLGEGGMGTVWLADDTALQRQVAVKILHPELASEPEALSRFQQEARAVAKIDSAHVVRVFDLGTTNSGEPYIVMELCAGEDLKKVIEQGGPLTPALTVTVVQQLCSGLARAHELGLVHRDIKPANILVGDDDGVHTVKITDFGIARFVASTHLGMTTTGSLMGTPYYMSPEQFVDPRAIDHRSDLWAVAVVAYACLLGTLPFQGETIGAQTIAVHSGVFALPTRTNGDLPPALDDFFLRALQVDPERRHASAEELSSAFCKAMGGAVAGRTLGTLQNTAPTRQNARPRPIAPPQPGSPPPVAAVQFRRRPSTTAPTRRVAVVLGLATLVGSGAVAAIVASQLGQTAAADTRAASKPSSSKKKKRRKKAKKRAQPSRGRTPPPADTTVPTPPSPLPSPASPPSLEPPTPPSPRIPPLSRPVPKPALRFTFTGSSCVASVNATCPPASQCCRGRRDRAVFAPAEGTQRAKCRCMRPVCATGENPATHACQVR